jgi:streptomycin 6-kinase
MTEEEKYQLNELYQHNSLAIFAVLNKFKQEAQDKEGDELLAVRRAEAAALFEVVNNIKRVLAYRSGEKIEPVSHSGEAVLQMVGGIS